MSRSITSLSNHLRALFYEYGIVSTVGVKGLNKTVLEALDETSLLPECLRSTLNRLWMTDLNLKAELVLLTKTGLVRQLQPCKVLMDLEEVAEVENKYEQQLLAI